MTEKLHIYQDIEIKFVRLRKPSLNKTNLSLPLSGLYNDLNNQEYQNYPLKNKFKNFNISSPECVNIENLFSINTSFGKLLTSETLEGLLILTNISKRKVTITNLNVSFIVDTPKQNPGNTEENTPLKKSSNISLPDKNNSLTLNGSQSYSIKLKNFLQYASKYTIDINLKTQSESYNQEYDNLTINQKMRIENKTKDYVINNNKIQYLLNKKLTFFVNDPFKIDVKFYNNQLEQCLLEIKIKNQTKKILNLSDILLTSTKNIIIEPMQKLQDFVDESESRIIALKPEEELNFLYKSDPKNYDTFLTDDYFDLYIKWLNLFDFLPNTFNYQIKNTFVLRNNYFKILILEKPKDNKIIKNEYFNLTFKFIAKQQKQNLILDISCENSETEIKDKMINIIDIKNKKIELNEGKDCNEGILNIVCQSDKDGVVFFPSLRIVLYEGNEAKKINYFFYYDLLKFNCE